MNESMTSTIIRLNGEVATLTSRLEASERANSEMREALNLIIERTMSDCFANITAKKVLFSTSGQSYIPREVWEKMYEALESISYDHKRHEQGCLVNEALQLSQSYGLGKEKV